MDRCSIFDLNHDCLLEIFKYFNPETLTSLAKIHPYFLNAINTSWFIKQVFQKFARENLLKFVSQLKQDNESLFLKLQLCQSFLFSGNIVKNSSGREGKSNINLISYIFFIVYIVGSNFWNDEFHNNFSKSLSPYSKKKWKLRNGFFFLKSLPNCYRCLFQDLTKTVKPEVTLIKRLAPLYMNFFLRYVIRYKRIHNRDMYLFMFFTELWSSVNTTFLLN